MQEAVITFLKALEAEGRASTAEGYGLALRNFCEWSERHGIEVLRITLRELENYQRYLADEYKSPNRVSLARATQAARLAAVKSFYKWATRRRMIVSDPSVKLHLPTVARQRVACEALTQQELAAMLESQSQRVKARREGSFTWASELRNLAMLCVAVATGRRRSGVLSLKSSDVDFDRNELRIEREKGQSGRVLPCAPWAMAVLKKYTQSARPILLSGKEDTGVLFPGNRRPRCSKVHLRELVLDLQRRTAEENPDLTELASKRIGTHGLRVTCARMLFLNGADIRAVNEILLHRKLSTTSRYTPLAVDELRGGIRPAHPRA